MYNNLTGAIAANVTLIQPGYNGTLALILAAFLGALVAGGIALIRDYKKSKTAEKQRKQQVYSQLMGHRNLLIELFATNLSNAIGVKFYTIRHVLANEEKDIERAYQLEERNAILRLELAKCIQKLFETIGSFIFLFHIPPDHQMIKDLYDMLYKISKHEDNPKLKFSEDIKTFDDLMRRDTAIEKEINENIVPNIASPIDAILKYLEKDEAQRKGWWQFWK
jgi:hypothetical protein